MISVWAIYLAPAGSPAPYIVQRWDGATGEKPRPTHPLYAATLDLARQTIPRGMERHDPSPAKGESPRLIETWEAKKS